MWILKANKSEIDSNTENRLVVDIGGREWGEWVK